LTELTTPVNSIQTANAENKSHPADGF